MREQLRRGCRAYMEACAEPTVARILADAPAVLGVAACRALDAAACIPLLEDAFAGPEQEGIEVPGDPDVAASPAAGLPQRGGQPDRRGTRRTARLRRGSRPRVDAFLDKLFV